jgi:hypothetical protein
MKNFLILTLFILTCFSINSTYSQQNLEKPEHIIVPSYAFENEIHYDVFVKVIKCENDLKEYVVITTFNESGATRNIGLNVKLFDKKGNKQVIVVPPFKSKFMEVYSSSCKGENLDKNLRKELSSLIDKSSMGISVEFNIAN